jgi:hypothetical protein
MLVFCFNGLLLDVTGILLQVSAYSSFARMGVGLGLEQQRRRLDPSTNEPLFTNCTRDFIGTLDYIFYTGEILCNTVLSIKFVIFFSLPFTC